jgi:hypothetical protein
MEVSSPCTTDIASRSAFVDGNKKHLLTHYTIKNLRTFQLTQKTPKKKLRRL